MTEYSPHYCNHCGAAYQEQAATHCGVCGSLLSAPPGDPLLKGRYRLLGQVGQGGFATVYRAEDTHRGDRLVAIKDFHLDNLSDREALEATEAFQRETSFLATLTHAHLPHLHDHFVEDGHSYLVRDFVQGETLEHYAITQGGHLPLNEVLDVGIQLCRVLEYLHTQDPPLVFRDLKPSNIIRTASGHLYLIDFGIARHYKPGQAHDTELLGSPGYAAPEQYGRAQTTPRTDIYSLGALLHSLLTGSDPSETPFRFAQLPEHFPVTPAQLRSLLMQLVELDAHKRPANVALIKREFEQTLVTMQVEEDARVLYLRHRRLVLDLSWSPDGTSMVSATADGLLHLWDVRTERTTGSHAGPTDYAWVATVAWSPDGALIASSGDQKFVRVWRVMRDEENSLTFKPVYLYRGHTSWVNSIAWSPDGKWLASGSDDTTVHLWQMENTTHYVQAQLYRGHSRWVTALAWSPDGVAIASGGNDAVVRVWNTSTQETLCTYHGHRFGVRALAWSPDGTRIASCSWDRSIHVWDVKNGKMFVAYRKHADAVHALAWSPDSKYIVSAGCDKTVQIWDTATGHTLHTYRGHTGWLYTVAWSPDGTRIASAGNDKTIHIWQFLPR